MPAWTSSGERLVGCKIVTRLSGQREARQAVGLRQLSADVRRDRRAARRDGRHRAHRLAHRLRLRARGLLSGARGCLASRDGRRGRARAASGARACGVRPIRRVTIWNRTRGNAVQAAFALSRRAASSPRSPTISKPRCARPTSSPARRSRRRRSCAASGSRRARISIWSAPTRRRCARRTTTRSSRARVYVDTRAGAPKEARRHRAAAEVGRPEEDRHPRRPVRALPRRGQGPHQGERDHAVQVGRHGDRGPGGRDAGVAVGCSNSRV